MVVKQAPAVERLNVVRHWYEDGDSLWVALGVADSKEEAVEMCRLDAERRQRWGTYRAVRESDPNRPVEITIRQNHYRFEALIVLDPQNPRMTDEAIMARFDYPEAADIDSAVA